MTIDTGPALPIVAGHDAGPLVSVALATYNGVAYLEELLASIEAQDYARLEIVVSDDGSTDGTLELLSTRSWARPHRLLPSSGRAGVIGNFSRALAGCEGRYVALSDQDDYWRADKISSLVARIETLERDGDRDAPALVFSDIEVVDDQLRTSAQSFFAASYNSSACRSFADFLLTNHVPGCATLFNRALLQRALPVPAGFHMHDWWLMATAAAFGRIDYVDLPLIKYRQHAGNVVGAGERRRTVSSRLRKVLRPGAWIAWVRFIVPPLKAVEITVNNLRLLEQRYGTSLPPEARASLDLLRASGRNPLQAARFVAGARTGERALYAVALSHLAARRLQA